MTCFDSVDSKSREESAKLLGCLIKACERLMDPYIEPVLKVSLCGLIFYFLTSSVVAVERKLRNFILHRSVLVGFHLQVFLLWCNGYIFTILLNHMVSYNHCCLQTLLNKLQEGSVGTGNNGVIAGVLATVGELSRVVSGLDDISYLHKSHFIFVPLNCIHDKHYALC